MIAGIGIDLCRISRMEALIKNDAFLNRYFAPGEAAYIRNQGAMAAASLAGCYAAKEAFVKALGEGFRGIPLSDVAVDHTQKGAPFYAATGKALEALEARGITQAHLSITHEGEMAAALCVLEG
jgi:holo-[acyl-carrier protein] synthase